MSPESTPLVTVVITAFNRPDMLRQAISSVVQQTFRDLELIVVDDCSSEELVGVVESFRDSRVHYVRHNQNQGGVAARNTGSRMARDSQYLAFLDDDDVWKPDKLQKQVALSNQRGPEYAVIYCGATAVGENGEVIGETKPRLRGCIKSEFLKKGLNTVSSSHLFRRDAYQALDGYDESLPGNNEHDIWMEMARHGYKADYVDEPLVTAYQHRQYRMTSDVGPRINAVKTYLDKWQPELLVWLGQKDGRAYCHRYFARVIASLAADRVAAGELAQAKQAVAAIFSYSPKILYNVLILLERTSAHIARSLLPKRVIRLLRSVRKVIVNRNLKP